MTETENKIFAECKLFVCRICHTKTGHPHQRWCIMHTTGKSGCEDCVYWREAEKKCRHPYRKKGGEAK